MHAHRQTQTHTPTNRESQETKTNAQQQEHRHVVLLLLSEYLARTTKVFTQLQSERAKLAAERQRIQSHQSIKGDSSLREKVGVCVCVCTGESRFAYAQWARCAPMRRSCVRVRVWLGGWVDGWVCARVRVKRERGGGGG